MLPHVAMKAGAYMLFIYVRACAPGDARARMCGNDKHNNDNNSSNNSNTHITCKHIAYYNIL